jgi:hypothetical protein
VGIPRSIQLVFPDGSTYILAPALSHFQATGLQRLLTCSLYLSYCLGLLLTSSTMRTGRWAYRCRTHVSLPHGALRGLAAKRAPSARSEHVRLTVGLMYSCRDDLGGDVCPRGFVAEIYVPGQEELVLLTPAREFYYRFVS